jgi:hypothetical protein
VRSVTHGAVRRNVGRSRAHGRAPVPGLQSSGPRATAARHSLRCRAGSLDVARGREQADLVITGGRLANVHTRELVDIGHDLAASTPSPPLLAARRQRIPVRTPLSVGIAVGPARAGGPRSRRRSPSAVGQRARRLVIGVSGPSLASWSRHRCRGRGWRLCSVASRSRCWRRRCSPAWRSWGWSWCGRRPVRRGRSTPTPTTAGMPTSVAAEPTTIARALTRPALPPGASADVRGSSDPANRSVVFGSSLWRQRSRRSWWVM